MQVNNINFIKEKRFDDLVSDLNMKLPFDFFLPDYKILIEYDGKHHFFPIEYYGGEKVMNRTKSNDELKNIYVLNSPDLFLIRIPYTEKQNIEPILMNYIFDIQRDKFKNC